MNPYATIFPLVLVLSITAIKEGIEDYQRAKSDRYFYYYFITLIFS